MRQLNSVGKSVCTGAAAAGLISLIPIINLLNLLLMMWMGVGGGICVYLLLKKNSQITFSDAMITGAVTGALGWVIFGSVTFLAISNIPEEKIQRMMEIARLFSSITEEEINQMLQGNELKVIFLTFMGFALFFSIVSGALGGIITRRLFRKSKING